MMDKGCGCKGSLNVHTSCFQAWVKTAENPFQCPVCKTGYNATFMSTFMTVEQMLLHGDHNEEEDDDEEVEYLVYQQHGVSVMEHDGNLYFQTEKDFAMYNHSYKMEKKSERMDCYRKQRNAMQFCTKRSKNYARGRGQVQRMRK